MDFRELLLEADKNQKIAAKQSQQVKRISTHFTNPVKKEEKSNQPKSEALQKLLHEKEKERRQRKEEEGKQRRKEEKKKEQQEREEKAKNVFRIPKKSAPETPASDAESFSSISSDDESVAKKSSSQRRDEASHKSSSHGHSSGHRDNGSSSDKASSKQRSKESSIVESSSKLNGRHGDKHSSSHSHKHSSSGGDKHSSSNKTKHSSSHSHKHSSSSSDKHSSADKDKLSSSNKHKHLSDKHLSSSSSAKHKSSSDGHKSDSKTLQKVHSNRQDKYVENDSSGYITSPDLTSEEEEEDRKGKSAEKDLPSSKKDGSGSKTEDPLDTPVTLTRHHLKPTIERKGCPIEARNQVLAKLQSIREKMTSENDSSPSKRVRGDVKRRRSKREKLEGDFTGSCMEKIVYDEEEKPSLKRPEPKPEEIKPVKVRKRYEKLKESPHKNPHKKVSSSKDRSSSDSKHSLTSKQNRFDAMKEKPKKPRPVHRPPPVNFADLLKMAEQKQAVPVMVETKPKKKEKERRPMTQEEIDRQRTREERVKSQEYKDWYKFGEKAVKREPGNSSGADATGGGAKDKESGGFLRRDNNVIPPCKDSSRSKASANSSRDNLQPPSVHHNQKPSSSSSHPSSGFKPQPHPTRPGMIANKPLAMAQHVSNGQKPSQGSARPPDEAKKRPASPEARSARSPSPQPRARAYDAKGGSAWDKLFSRPEYKKLKEPPAKKGRMMIDSDSEEEEEDDYDDMDDFIDDEGEENMDSVSGAIRQLFGYDKRRYRDEDEDDRNMEVGFSQVMKEEARSARLGRQEDLEDIRKEQEELRLKALKKKKR